MKRFILQNDSQPITFQTFFRKAKCTAIGIYLFLSPISLQSDELPLLNDSLSGFVSHEQEKQIGNILIRQVRAQLPTVSDPLSSEYLQSLSYQLAENSTLFSKDIKALIIKDTSINAFAMPGGIIAVNTGLFRYAESEDELSAVLSHEIAHLSQRHFARMVAEQRNQQITSMGAYIASVLVLLTVGTEPGIGAMAATQAAAEQSALAYSRKNEQEADRIGMQTLVDAGKDPNAMITFFLKLQNADKFSGEQAPEYMLTHPVTDSRIADTRTRISEYPKKKYQDELEFHLIKNRLTVIESDNLDTLIQKLEHSVKKSTEFQLKGELYGLAIAYTERKQFKSAQRILEKLLKDDSSRIDFLLANAELYYEMDDFNKAKSLLEEALELHPDNYPLSMLYAETLIRNKQIPDAIYLLQNMTVTHHEEPYVWRRLAEAHGLLGHRLDVYLAKAEYFYLYGLNEQASAQLKFALPLSSGNFQLNSKIQERIKQIEQEENEIRI